MQINSFENPEKPKSNELSKEQQLLLDQQQQLIDEYRQKHADIVDFEDYIAAEVTKVIQETLNKEGRLLPEREAIEKGIDRFRAKMKKMMAQAEQDIKNQSMNRMALNLDVNTGSSAAQKKSIDDLSAEEIWTMPREKFEAMDRKLTRQYYV